MNKIKMTEERVEVTRRSTLPSGEKAECVVIALSDVRRLSLVQSEHAGAKSERIQESKAADTSDQVDEGTNTASETKGGSGALRGYSVSIRRDTISLVNKEDDEEYDLAHRFKEHTYRGPTCCDVCTGLLVGLWSQGLQCESCGLNTHRGEGIGDHDDCRAEAMLAPCDCDGTTQSRSDESKTLGEAVREVQELARERPDFFRAVREQMDKDVMTHVKEAVVSAGVEEERDKNLRRIKEKLLPLLEFVDEIEARGEIHSLARLLRFHVKVALFSGAIGLVVFILAVLWRHGFRLTESSFRLALVHESTVLVTVHMGLLVVAAALRYYAALFKRKTKVIDQFLRDKFGIDAKEDLGVSVAGAARRARWWSERVFISVAITAYAEICFWYAVQPSMETLMYVDRGVCPAEK